MNFTPEKKAVAEKFLTELAEHAGLVTKAAEATGITRMTAYNWRKADENFAAAWDQVIESAIEDLEHEARRRAFVRVEKPVYQSGKLVGHIQEYSDTLLIFLLKAHRPEKYRDQVKVTVQEVDSAIDAAIKAHNLNLPVGIEDRLDREAS